MSSGADIVVGVAFVMLWLVILGVAIMIAYLRAWALRKKAARQDKS
jgi:hypothetical protein